MAEACASAFAVTGEERSRSRAARAAAWFLGDERHRRRRCSTPETGGCCDGLEAGGRNENQGAESTLAMSACAAASGGAQRASSSSVETVAAPDGTVGRAVGQVDRRRPRCGSAPCTKTTLFTSPCRSQSAARAHDRLGQDRLHLAGLVVEQRRPRPVVLAARPLVEEEQQPVVGRDRRRAGADAERAVGRPDDRVPVELAMWPSQ